MRKPYKQWIEITDTPLSRVEWKVLNVVIGGKEIESNAKISNLVGDENPARVNNTLTKLKNRGLIEKAWRLTEKGREFYDQKEEISIDELAEKIGKEIQRVNEVSITLDGSVDTHE